MADEYTEVSEVSFLSNLKNSIIGVIIGPLFFIGAIPLLFWNEGKQTYFLGLR